MSPVSSLFVLMLLSCIMQTQVSGRPPSCPTVLVQEGLPDRQINSGTMFRLHLPPRAFQGPVQRFQVSLVNDQDTLPKWLVYSTKNGTLQGLALREDGGEYIFRVTAMGKCETYTPAATTHFLLRILSDLYTDTEPTHLKHALPTDMSRSNLGCPAGEAITLADLVLHVDPVCMGATERLKLVTTLSDYLHVSPNSVALLSYREASGLRQENTTILAMGSVTSRVQGTDGGSLNKEQSKAEVFWTVGCGDFEMLPDLVQVLQHNIDSGLLSVLLGVPVEGWREHWRVLLVDSNDTSFGMGALRTASDDRRRGTIQQNESECAGHIGL
ncbi:hypothetical protein MATL_G00260600 [Megalops atlanticus]|uniref:Uncharacterized protein n=1 Tax=Megalops atlanticus TaxID=7932 RepID=A0A9D3P8N1_MEGAT|nr:hypothetical protein MATL_G00260600 [Megalops atlanticus]